MTDDLRAALGNRYSLERELGRGGMATVYLALDLKLQRRVALKVLRPELAASLGTERFLREIAIAARLSHPHILPLHDSGEAGGHLYYAMPYVEGESLRQRLEREGQLPIGEVIAIVRAVASALTYGHQLGIVHRDIKPDNILLAQDASGGPPHPLVADFGIARALDVAGGERLTETGLALGTPAYMSPEGAAAGSRLDGRSDIYALGCVAYEMLAGAPPFSGPTAEVIRARHAMDPVPPLHTVRATVPESLQRAIKRALAKKPDDRFATADQFAEALTAEPTPVQLLRRNLRSHRAKLVGTLTAIGVAAVASIMLLGRSSPAVVPSAVSIAVLPFGSATRDSVLTKLGRDLATTLGTSLEGVGGIKTADRLRIANETADRPDLSPAEGAALAHRLGARSFLKGRLVPAGDNVRLEFGLYSTADRAPVVEGITVTAHRDSVLALTDSAAWALLRQVWRRGDPPSPSLAAVTTHSLPALRAFLDGERELGANRWPEAGLAFKSAIAADSSFWLAYFRYALTQFWNIEPVDSQVLDVVRRHSHVFPGQERMLADAFLTHTLKVRIERYRAVTRKFPDYWPGWFLYADAIHHGGALIGYDWYEALGAFHRVVELNPKLVPAWEHIFWHTFGRNQAEASQAVTRLAELGWSGQRDQLFRLQAGVIRAGGVIPPNLDGLADSIAELMRSPSTYIMKYGPPGLPLLFEAGSPAAQIDLNRRALAAGIAHPKLRTALQAANAWAWAARGSWDSALINLREVVTERPGVIGLQRFSPPRFPPIGGPVLGIESYGMAVVGAWLAATPPTLADQRRPAALAAIDLLDNEVSKQDGRARVAWFDGLLAYTRRSGSGIQTARRNASRSGYYQADLVERSLAAFNLALDGDRKRAGRELASIEERCVDEDVCNSFTPPIAVQRLLAANWLEQAGDGEQARRLLRWQDANVWFGWGGWPWVLNVALAGPTYLARARLEEVYGEPARAREYYKQFLRYYDQPMPSQVNLVREAKDAIARLANHGDPGPAP